MYFRVVRELLIKFTYAVVVILCNFLIFIFIYQKQFLYNAKNKGIFNDVVEQLKISMDGKKSTIFCGKSKVYKE